MIRFLDGSLVTETYAADGLRRRTNAFGRIFQYVRDATNLLQRTNLSGVMQEQYLDFPGYWGGLVSQHKGGASSYFAFDLQANTRLLTTASGGVADTYSWKAFGETVAQTGTIGAYAWFGGAVGYQYDHNRGGYWARARSLQPSQGRWMSRDPLGVEAGHWNLYGYVENQPTAEVDPSGLRRRRRRRVPRRRPPQQRVDCRSAFYCVSKITSNPCHGRECRSPAPIDPYFLVCLFWQETNLGATAVTPGNIGRLTPDALQALDDLCCNPKHYRQGQRAFIRASWCEKATLTAYYLSCKGIRAYGPDYRGSTGAALVARIQRCASCLRKSGVLHNPMGILKEIEPCQPCLDMVHT